MSVAKYTDLEAWQSAMRVVVEVYRITRSFPADERVGLTQQLRRAAVSVTSNLAEGQARRTKRDFIRFITIALGSLAEVECQFLVAERLEIVDAGQLTKAMRFIGETGRLLRGLERNLIARSINDLPP